MRFSLHLLCIIYMELKKWLFIHLLGSIRSADQCLYSALFLSVSVRNSKFLK
jgi:hypothetical protein